MPGFADNCRIYFRSIQHRPIGFYGIVYIIGLFESAFDLERCNIQLAELRDHFQSRQISRGKEKSVPFAGKKSPAAGLFAFAAVAACAAQIRAEKT